MRNFEVLFDQGEDAPFADPAFERYGKLGFPLPPEGRPWIFSNFVQSLDGIVSLKGTHAAGSDIAHSEEDRWLMDLLRAHADALIMGVNTLIEEKALGGRERGPVFRIQDEALRELRGKLGRGRERNIFVTGSGRVDLSEFRVFDGDEVDAVVITTRAGYERLRGKQMHPQVRILAIGEDRFADLGSAIGLLHREFGVRYLLCEGGPTLYGHLACAGLMDEKFLTMSPVEVGQRIPPEQPPSPLEAYNPLRLRPTAFPAPGFTEQSMPWWKWLSCRRVGDHQFCRYRRR
jgi:riboflavin biosynthesis pyrimidine reductase